MCCGELLLWIWYEKRFSWIKVSPSMLDLLLICVLSCPSPVQQLQRKELERARRKPSPLFDYFTPKVRELENVSIHNQKTQFSFTKMAPIESGSHTVKNIKFCSACVVFAKPADSTAFIICLKDCKHMYKCIQEREKCHAHELCCNITF